MDQANISNNNVHLAHKKNRGSERVEYLSSCIVHAFQPFKDRYSAAQVKQRIRMLNIEHNEPPLSKRELEEKYSKTIDLMFDDENADDFMTLDEAEEQPIEWLVYPWLPKGEITIMAGDGGGGKTSLWISIVAALASGRVSFFDQAKERAGFDAVPFNEPHKVLFLTTEDSVSKKIKKAFAKYDLSNDAMKNILYIDAGNPNIMNYMIDSENLQSEIERHRPALVVLDPLQGFLADGVDMGKRNQMRHALAPLKFMGDQFGTTFLIIAHTNKRTSNVSARGRVADSADIWDIARSVLLVGATGKKDQDGKAVKYLSAEKANYAAVEDIPTILFTLPGGKVEFHGITDKKDAELIDEKQRIRQSAQDVEKAKPVQSEIADEIVNFLQTNGGKVTTPDLDNYIVENLGFAKKTYSRTKTNLHNQGVIEFQKTGDPKHRVNYTILIEGK